jgi:hypothetical protein
VEEAIKEPAELEKWKRTMMVWRCSLLMAVAVCQNQPQVNLTKDTLDELYDDYLYGRDILRKSNPPSLQTMKISERKFWREVSLRMLKAKGRSSPESLEDIVKALRMDTLFWQREVYEYCHRASDSNKADKTAKKWKRSPGNGKGSGDGAVRKRFTKKNKGTKGGRKGKQKGKGKRSSKAATCHICGKAGHLANQCWQNTGQQQGGRGITLPPAMPAFPPPAPGANVNANWAQRGADGKVPCREYHGRDQCRFGTTCRFSHLCPVLVNGSPCGQPHRASEHR